MRKTITFGFILASALAVSTLAIAAPDNGGAPGGWHGHHGEMSTLNQLNLTDAQRASIKQIVGNSFAQNKTQRDSLRQQREAFEAMTPDQVGYQAAATSLAQAEGAAMTQHVQQRATIRAQIYNLLSTSQKAQLASIHAAHEARRQQWEQFKAQHPVTSSTTPTAQ